MPFTFGSGLSQSVGRRRNAPGVAICLARAVGPIGASANPAKISTFVARRASCVTTDKR